MLDEVAKYLQRELGLNTTLEDENRLAIEVVAKDITTFNEPKRIKYLTKNERH